MQAIHFAWRLLLCLLMVVALSDCGTSRLSQLPQSEHARDAYNFPKTPSGRRKSQQQSSASQRQALSMPGLIAELEQAVRAAKRNEYTLAERLMQRTSIDVSSLPKALRGDWHMLSADLAYRHSRLTDMLLNEQQLALFLPNQERVKRNSILLDRLLSFGFIQVQLARRDLAENLVVAGWLDLAATLTSLPATASQQRRAWLRWQKAYPGHSAGRYRPNQLKTFFTAPQGNLRMSVLLPHSGPLTEFGNVLTAGFSRIAQNPDNHEWRVSYYNVTNQDELNNAIDWSIKNNNQVFIGPLQPRLVERLWGNPRVLQALSLNYIANPAGGRQLAQFGLGVEDEADWIGNFVNSQPQLRVAALVHTSLNAERAMLRLHEVTKRGVEAYRFNTSSQLTNQLENAIGVSSYDINIFKKKYKDFTKQLEDTTDDEARELLAEQDPIHTIREKIRLDLLIIFADDEYAAQVMPLMDFYFANQIMVIGYSSAYNLAHRVQNSVLDGMYLVDIPALGINPDKWHEWVGDNVQVQPGFYRFYAMGVDAALLAHNLPKLIASPGFRIRGTTGRLGYDAKQRRIRRDLDLFRIVNDQPVKVPAEATPWLGCTPAPAEGGDGGEGEGGVKVETETETKAEGEPQPGTCL